jgi:hypothetical protein
MALSIDIDLHVADGALDRELQLARARAVYLVEQIEERDRDIESARLLVAARVFAGVIEIYAERRRLEGAGG